MASAPSPQLSELVGITVLSNSKAVIREEVHAFKRQRILEEARILFYERGYTGTTLDAVAERLDMTKQFVYSYYKTKGEILVDICASGARHSLEVVEQALALNASPTNKLKQFAREYSRVICEQQLNVTIYLREEKNLSDQEAETFHELRRAFDKRLSALLNEGMRAGEFNIPDIRLTTLAIGGMIGWATFWYRPQGRLSMPALMDGMMELVLRTVGADKGRDTSSGSEFPSARP